MCIRISVIQILEINKMEFKQKMLYDKRLTREGVRASLVREGNVWEQTWGTGIERAGWVDAGRWERYRFCTRSHGPFLGLPDDYVDARPPRLLSVHSGN